VETIENLATVKARLSEFVDSAQRTHERIIITKNGRPAALLMSVEDYEGLLETLEVLSDPEAMRQLRESQEAVDAGDVVPLAQVRNELAARLAAADEPAAIGAGSSARSDRGKATPPGRR
jgi:antitoxin YefM